MFDYKLPTTADKRRQQIQQQQQQQQQGVHIQRTGRLAKSDSSSTQQTHFPKSAKRREQLLKSKREEMLAKARRYVLCILCVCVRVCVCVCECMYV